MTNEAWTIQVRSSSVGGSYLTAGKIYECRLTHNGLGGYITNDNGDENLILLKNCAHLQGGDWEIVKEHEADDRDADITGAIISLCAGCGVILSEGHGVEIRNRARGYETKDHAPCENCHKDTIPRSGRIECLVSSEDYDKIRRLRG